MADIIIPNDEESQGVTIQTYSLNRLKNPSAETGTLVDWLAVNASVVDGGAEGSTKVFRLGPDTGSMLQTIQAAGAQPPDYRIKGLYLPDVAIPDNATLVKAFVKVVMNYADGTKDVALLPVRGAVSNGA